MKACEPKLNELAKWPSRLRPARKEIHDLKPRNLPKIEAVKCYADYIKPKIHEYESHSVIKKTVKKEGSWDRFIAIPSNGEELTWHLLPKGIYTYGKIYPTCKCGRKYVPCSHIQGADKECLFCVLTKGK